MALRKSMLVLNFDIGFDLKNRHFLFYKEKPSIFPGETPWKSSINI